MRSLVTFAGIAVIVFMFRCPACSGQEPEHKATDKVIVRAWLIEVNEGTIDSLSDVMRRPDNLARWLKDQAQGPVKANGCVFDAADILLMLDRDPTQPPVGRALMGMRLLELPALVLARSAVNATDGKWGTFDNTTAIQYLERKKEPRVPHADLPEPIYVVRTMKEQAGTVFTARPEIRDDGQVAVEFGFSWTRVESRLPVDGAETLPVGLPTLRTHEVKSKVVAKPSVPVIGGERSRVTTHTDDKGNKTEVKDNVYLLLEVEIPKAGE